MSWGLSLSLGFALVYLAWIWRGSKADSRVRFTLCLIGSTGILIILACDYIKTLPSHAPLRTVTGLVTYRHSLFLSRSHWDFILAENGTDRRILFTTLIDGPWADQPVCVTYIADGSYMSRVVRIEILSGAQFPWLVGKGHAGWVGTTEAKRSAPPVINVMGIVFVVVGVFARGNRKDITDQQSDNGDVANLTTPDG